MERLGGAIGYILGTIFIVPLLFILINKYSINRNDFSIYKDDYLKNTREILLETKYFEEDPISGYHVAITKSFTTNRAAAAGGRDLSSRSRRHYRMVRDSRTGNFFAVTVIDGSDLVFSAIDNNRFVARVNVKDLESDFYGSSENPIPVFSVRGIDKPLEDYNLNGDVVQLDISEEQYAYSAEMYWTYIATKEEFEKRFGKQK